MDTMQAFMRGQASRGDPMRVFDWDEAARRIRDKKPRVASAGLGGDWEYTGGTIYRNDKPVDKDDTYTYLASTWAVPELDLDGEVDPCWKWQKDSPGWDAKTYWPESALEILNKKD